MFVIEESSTEGLMGLYEGATALAAGDGMPERITLYKRAHEEAPPTRSTSWSPRSGGRSCTRSGHHFGMDEDDLPY